MGLLGEQKIKDYGSRLVRKIKLFVEENNLQEYIANRPGKRNRIDDDEDDNAATKVAAVVVQSASSSAARAGKAKARKAIIEIDSDDEFDEFGTDIDFANMDIP